MVVSMILTEAIVFNDETLYSMEELLNSPLSSGLGENLKNAMRKACSDYRLLKKYLPAKGLSREIIFFLLDPCSNTSQGIKQFFEKLTLWIKVVSDHEQELCQEVLEYYDADYVHTWDHEKISQIRDSLMSVIYELQFRLDCNSPMQTHPNYLDWESEMNSYGHKLSSVK